MKRGPTKRQRSDTDTSATPLSPKSRKDSLKIDRLPPITTITTEKSPQPSQQNGGDEQQQKQEQQQQSPLQSLSPLQNLTLGPANSNGQLNIDLRTPPITSNPWGPAVPSNPVAANASPPMPSGFPGLLTRSVTFNGMPTLPPPPPPLPHASSDSITNTNHNSNNNRPTANANGTSGTGNFDSVAANGGFSGQFFIKTPQFQIPPVSSRSNSAVSSYSDSSSCSRDQAVSPRFAAKVLTPNNAVGINTPSPTSLPSPPSLPQQHNGRPSISFPFNAPLPTQKPSDTGQDTNSGTSNVKGEALLANWDDRSIDSYYQMIHPTLPILPPNRGQLRHRLMSCPDQKLSHIMLSVVSSTVRQRRGSNSCVTPVVDTDGSSTILDYLLQPASGTLAERQQSSDILRLMCLILLYLNSRSSVILGAACSLAFEMRLHLADVSAINNSGTTAVNDYIRPLNFYSPASQSIPSPPSKHSPLSSSPSTATASPSISQAAALSDTDFAASRRLFLLLVLLDRLHSTIYPHIPLHIADQYVHIVPHRDVTCFQGLQPSLELVRLSLLIGRVDNGSVCSSATAIPPQQIKLQLDSLGRSIEGLWDTTPILKAVYFFASLVVHRSAPSQSQIEDALALAFALESPLLSVSPLMTYFATVLNETLCILASRTPSDQRLHQLSDILENNLLRQNPHLAPVLKQGLQAVSQTLGQQRLEGLAAVAHQLQSSKDQ